MVLFLEQSNCVPDARINCVPHARINCVPDARMIPWTKEIFGDSSRKLKRNKNKTLTLIFIHYNVPKHKKFSSVTANLNPVDFIAMSCDVSSIMWFEDL